MEKLLWIIMVIGCISCGSESDCGNAFGTPFDIREGRTYCLTDDTSIVIDEISESYCPCNADCIWEGEAQVTLRRVSPDGEETFTIHEVRNEDDPSWLRIHEVSITEACDPDIASISITVSR